MSLDHNGKTIISWSLNPPELIGTPNLKARLEAAEICDSAGYRIGFHFDPIIHYSNWEKGYRFVVQEIPKYVNPENIAWISLGALRYPVQLNNIIKRRHRQSQLPYGELLRGKGWKTTLS